MKLQSRYNVTTQKLVIAACLFFCAGLLQAQLPYNGQGYINSMEVKRKLILSNADTAFPNTKFIFYHVEALFCNALYYSATTADSVRYTGMGKRLFTRAMDMVYAKRVNDTTFQETGFVSWPLMQCYTRYKKYLTPSDTQRVRKFAQYNDFSIGNTSNLTLMGAVGAYLAVQNFGIQNIKFGYNSNDKAAWNSVIAPRLRSTVFEEIPEIASFPYGTENADPLLTLALLANDANVRNRSLITFETILAEYAPCWLKGHLVKSSTRTYPHNAANGQVGWGVWGYLWYFFGGSNKWVDKAGYQYKKGSEYNQMAAAVQYGYMLPEIIYHVANDKSFGYTVTNTNSERGIGYRTATFLSSIQKDYALHTATVRIGGTNFWKNGVRWNITDSTEFTKRSTNNVFWITHPSDDTVIHNGAYNDQDGENASLINNTLFALYNTTYHNATSIYYALGFVPGGYSAFINEAATSNRIFLYYPNMLLAVSSSNAFQWNPQKPTLAPSPVAGTSEFRITDSTNCFAIVLEAASPVNFQGANDSLTLLNFRNAIKTNPLPQVTKKSLDANARPRLQYKDYQGNNIIMNFRGTGDWANSMDTINGAAQSYSNMPRIASPFINRNKTFNILANGQLVTDSTQPMTIQYGACKRTYNYVNWSILQSCIDGRPFSFITVEASKVSGSMAQINWQVKGEDSINHYELEKATNPGSFYFVKNISVSQVYAPEMAYNAIDAFTHLPVYYRVAAVLKNGRKIYSAIVCLLPDGYNGSGLNVFPNPSPSSGNNLQARLTNLIGGILQYQVFGADGRLYYLGSQAIFPGYNQFTLQTSMLSRGNYFVRWQLNKEQGNVKLLVL